MQLPVLIELTDGGGLVARCGEPFPIAVEGATKDEALQSLQAAIVTRSSEGVRLTSIDVPDDAHPLARFAGWLSDEPLYPDWQDAVRERRNEFDQTP